MKTKAVGLRNLGILAHIDAGKTSLTERVLYLAGRIRNPGAVDSGTTATDYLEVERERGITVKAACVRLAWGGCRINLIDTPGHVDFGAEVERSLRVLDGAVLVLCAVAGVQSRTEAILGAIQDRGLPALVFVNKLDRRGASFDRACAELSALCPRVVAIQYPLGEGAEWGGLVDLLDLSVVGAGTALPGAALEARRVLVERLAELDDGIMETWAAGADPSPEAMREALRAACVAGRLVPVLAGSAFSDYSVSALLDAVADFLPTPAERGCPEGFEPGSGRPDRRSPSVEAPFSALVFKTQSDERHGRLSWLRVWSGRVGAGDRLLEAGSGAVLRVQRLFAIQADSLEDLPAAEAGDIAALALAPAAGSARRPALGASTPGGGTGGATGLRGSPGGTGSSLCEPSSPILYERIGFEEPVVSVALEPVARADSESVKAALSALLEDDPSLRASEDAETGRMTLAGMGELHLEVAVERLRREHGVRLRVGAPQVSCREALRGSAEATCDFDRDMNGERVRGQVLLRLSPRGRGEGRRIGLGPSLRLPAHYIEALRRGVEASASVGPSGAWPVEDYEATVLACVPPASPRQAELALEMAASMAARDCLSKAGTQVLEPWMRIELELPEEGLGPAMAALSARGGRVESIEDAAGPVNAMGEGGAKLVAGAAPMRLLFGFASELRSATAGKASWQARFLRYEPERGARS